MQDEVKEILDRNVIKTTNKELLNRDIATAENGLHATPRYSDAEYFTIDCHTGRVEGNEQHSAGNKN
jgi:hypothetical protein